MKKLSSIVLVLLATSAVNAGADHSKTDLEQILIRVEALENENRQLKKTLETLIGSKSKDLDQTKSSKQSFIKRNAKYSFDMLDHTSNVNQKPKTILRYKKSGELGKGVYVGGSVTPIIDYQKSNTDSKFGYLMRHPTSANQLGSNVSEAVIHAAQFNFTANLTDKITAYSEFLYDPEQSFGTGTITALTRNQIQLRKGYLLYGDLNESPYYAALGKMAIPFGLHDTVNPFTSSTVWHAFGGLSYSALMGYKSGPWNVSLDAVQGGSQFRSANVPVSGSSVPSRLNNLAVDLNYTKELDESKDLLMGVSFIKGSAYCQGFPVRHFEPCADHNPAYAIYSRLTEGNRTYQLEWAETFDELPGSFNPNPPLNVFAASKVSSFQIGVRDRYKWDSKDFDLSLEFSRFKAGPSGSEWEKQDQLVLGLAHHVTDSVKLFGELIRVSGYVPLNFLSGGHIPTVPNVTHSVNRARSTVMILGADAAF